MVGVTPARKTTFSLVSANGSKELKRSPTMLPTMKPNSPTRQSMRILFSLDMASRHLSING